MAASAKENAGYRIALQALKDAFRQGAAGQPMHGLVLTLHESSQQNIAQGAYSTDRFYAEYQRGWRKFQRKAKP